MIQRRTILITISRGALAKNFLSTDFYEYLRSRFHLIILTPAHNDPRFIETYGREGVTFLPLPELELTRAEEILFFFHRYLIYNSTVRQKARWGIIGDPRSRQPSYLSYIALRAIFGPLSRLRFLRRFCRYTDRRFFQRNAVADFVKLLRLHDVSMVVSTNITEPIESALIKAAKEISIRSIGFPKSWDNLSKHGFRAKADHLVVWNNFMKEQAITFQDYLPEQVSCVGVMQYDFNEMPDMMLSREDFCAIYGLDSKRKIILLGSEGKLFPSDAVVARMIVSLVQDGSVPGNPQLLIRPHYGYKNDDKKFAFLEGMPGVVIDRFNNPSPAFRDAWDYSDAFTRRFINSMRHADVVVNTASTLTADAAYFDTPVINSTIDGESPEPYERSIARWYETDYFRHILSYGATTVVGNKEELARALCEYLADPSIRRDERCRLKNDFSFRSDGKAGVRFGALAERLTQGSMGFD